MATTGKPRTAAVASPPVAATTDALGVGFAWVIVELAPDAILVSDDRGRILMANRQVEHLFGYTRDDLVGAHVESLLPSRLRDAHMTQRASYETAPTVRTMGLGLELLGCHANGSEFPIEISLSPVATGHGTATVVVIRDVSAQRALEQTARTAIRLDHDEHIPAELHDRVVGHLFACGLTLARILGDPRHDDLSTERLHTVIDELDTAIREIRNTVFVT